MTAETINSHLKNGGVVQVTTYLRSTLYRAKHAGWFFEKDGQLCVQSGRSYSKLSLKDGTLLVGIRLGHME